MPELHPFPALRYTPAAGEPGALLAPPYDVIGPAEADELRARSPHNAVRLVLPEGPAPDRHALAARRLREWTEAGILAEDEEPAAYAYRQTFGREGGGRARWGVLAALHLAQPGAGEVLPHEQTHAGPKEDRLALTLACRAQLSAVFLTSADPDGRLLEALREAGTGEPVFEASTPDGVGHALWRTTGERAAGLCRAAAASPLLIADGHHRYETALEVRRRLPDSEAARAVLACVASEADPGLEVFPTHRAVSAPPPRGRWLEALEAAFEAEPLEGPDAPGAPTEGAAPPEARRGWVERSLAAARAQAAGRVAAERGGLVALAPSLASAHLLRPRSDALEAAGLAGDEGRIASLVFDRLVLRRTLAIDAEQAASRGFLSYHRDPAEAIAAAGAAGCAFLLPPVAIADVRRVAAAGRTLPPKSTYFAPKVPSGLLFRRL